MTEDLNFGDAVDELSGIRAFTSSVIKSKRGFDHPAIHEMVRDIVTPNLALFTPRIVERMQAITDRDLGHSEDRKLIENPLVIFQEMIASASMLPCVFLTQAFSVSSSTLCSLLTSFSSGIVAQFLLLLLSQWLRCSWDMRLQSRERFWIHLLSALETWRR